MGFSTDVEQPAVELVSFTFLEASNNNDNSDKGVTFAIVHITSVIRSYTIQQWWVSFFSQLH